MKKKLAIVAIIIGLGSAAVGQAYAGWGARNANCPNFQGPGYTQQVDPAAQQKLDAFFAENQELQKAIVMKRAEERALLSSETPDPALVSKVAGELFDLHTTLQQKADAAGVSQYLGPMGRGGFGRGVGMGAAGCGGPGNGPGRGMGRMMSGQGPCAGFNN